MRARILPSVLAVLTTLLVNVGSADDVQLQFASQAQRLAELEAELASFRGNELGLSCAGCGQHDCGCGPVWYAMGEAPYLQVNDAGVAIPGPPIMTPHYGQEIGVRALFGREWSNGLGMRVTGFHFEDLAGNGMLGPVGLRSQTEVYSVDIELTQRASFCGWDLTATGGVRIGGLNQELDVVTGVDTIVFHRDFDGAGLTAGFEFIRPVGETCWNAYGGFNGSLLFGDADIHVDMSGPNIQVISPTVATVPNQTVAIWEIQLGLEYRREFDRAISFMRFGVEAQLWEQPPVVLGLGDDNVGFFGPTIALGFER